MKKILTRIAKTAASVLTALALALFFMPSYGGTENEPTPALRDWAGGDGSAHGVSLPEMKLGGLPVSKAGAGDGKGILAYGIDVSKWQGCIDWEKVKADGIDFAILRLGLTSGMDRFFEVNYHGARAAGVDVGVYFYTMSSDEEGAKRDAALTLKWLEGKQLEYPVYYDIEHSAQSAMTKTERTDFCLAYCDVIAEAGYMTGLYASQSAMNNRFEIERIGEKYELWMASWPESGTPSRDYSDTRGMWQYTDKGSVDGINGDVDLDVAYRDYPALMTDLKLNGFENGWIDDTYDLGYYAVSSTTSLNVRAGPGSAYSRVDSLSSGSVVRILETDGIWGKISLGDTAGWICMYYTAFVADPSGAGSYTCTADVLNVRNDNSTDGEVIGRITSRDTAEVLGTRAGWALLSTDDGYGFASLDFLTLEENLRDYAAQIPDTAVSLPCGKGTEGSISAILTAADVMRAEAGDLIELTLYIDDADAVTSLWFDAGSGRTEAMRWLCEIKKLSLKDGWNKLNFLVCAPETLPSDPTDKTAAAFSDHFRLYLAEGMTACPSVGKLNRFSVGFTSETETYIAVAGEGIADSLRLIDHPDHSYALTDEKKSDCTESGEKLFNCSLCGVRKTETTDPLGHDHQLTSETPAGDYTAGEKVFTCSRCKDVVTERIPPLKALSGDLNGDGKVNPADAILILRYLSEWDGYETTPEIIGAGDLNGDGKLNPADAVILMRHLSGWEGYETLPIEKQS